MALRLGDVSGTNQPLFGIPHKCPVYVVSVSEPQRASSVVVDQIVPFGTTQALPGLCVYHLMFFVKVASII